MRAVSRRRGESITLSEREGWDGVSSRRSRDVGQLELSAVERRVMVSWPLFLRASASDPRPGIRSSNQLRERRLYPRLIGFHTDFMPNVVTTMVDPLPPCLQHLTRLKRLHVQPAARL